MDKDNDLDIEIVELASKNAAAVALQGGAVDLIVTDWFWVSRQRNEGREFAFVPHSMSAGGLIVSKDSKIKNEGDLEGKKIGRFGQLHPIITSESNITVDSYLFEIELNPLINASTRKNKLNKKFRPFPTVPYMERDISLIVDTSCSSSDIISVIKKAGKPLLEKVELVDRYIGKKLPENKISQAFRIRYRDPKTTLTEEDINPIHERIRKNLVNTLNAELRS